MIQGGGRGSVMRSHVLAQYHLKMVCFGLGNTNKWCTHCADGGLELGWMVQVGLFDTAFKVGCTGVHACVTSRQLSTTAIPLW